MGATISKSLIHNALLNHWLLSDLIINSYVEVYKTDHWGVKYFISRLKEGTITQGGKTYQVIYSNNTSKKKISENKKAFLYVSFRAPVASLALPNYVLIQFDLDSIKEK